MEYFHKNRLERDVATNDVELALNCDLTISSSVSNNLSEDDSFVDWQISIKFRPDEKQKFPEKEDKRQTKLFTLVSIYRLARPAADYDLYVFTLFH